jgi:prepilin-type N-terminal cleavage/methylation domain-containing protein
MRNGATLPELLTALALLGILLAIAVPPVGAARDRILLTLHARALVAAHADTRAAALRSGARTMLSISPAAFEQRSLAGDLLWQRPGPRHDGVDLLGPTSPIVFDSRGYTLGAANRTYRLSRNGVELRVIMSRLGRLRVVR